MNYQELTWPSLPDHIETDLLEFCRSESIENSTNKLNYSSTGRGQLYLVFNAPDYLINWVKENVPVSLEDNVVKLQVWRNTDQVRRHIDLIRDFSYNYLLMDHPGITRWFDNEEVTDSVKYEHKKWYKHVGGTKYHDVIHVNNFRAAVTIFKEIKPRPGFSSSLWEHRPSNT